MGAAYSLLEKGVGPLTLALVSANIIALVSLIGDGASMYLKKKGGESNSTAIAGTHIRLQLFRVFVMVLSVIAGLKLVLPSKLADDLIAAWFVGQGFALQSIIRNIISGIVVRYNKSVRDMIGKQVEYKDSTYSVVGTNLASVVLTSSNNGYTRIVPWPEIYQMKLFN